MCHGNLPFLKVYAPGVGFADYKSGGILHNEGLIARGRLPRLKSRDRGESGTGKDPRGLARLFGSGVTFIAFLLVPWIDENHAGRLKVGRVTGHQSEAVMQCCCGDQSIGRMKGSTHLRKPGCELTPKLRDVSVHRQHPVGEIVLGLGHPFFQFCFLFSGAEMGNTPGNLTDRNDTQEKIAVVDRREFCPNLRIPLWLANL